MSQHPGTAHRAERVEKLFTLPSRMSGSAPSPILDAAAWISGLWVVAAVLGVGIFSGGTTSLVLALVLLYGTGAALSVLGWLTWRGLRVRAARRLAAEPGASAARDFLAATAAAQAEFRAAVFPEGATGTPEVRRALASSRAAAEGAPSSVLPARPTTGSAVRTVPRSGKSPIRKNAVCKSAARRRGTNPPAPPVQDDFAPAA
ncbi:hypothetical protein [Arthrobacter sp. Edens01]|uniref:hypothetical protein n=1 Tax=Arthrobacter sp. Edens01 TaxID=1732020 RepID=UPI0006DB5EAE|nr:hypothetical protein [Arthrobacter sp. Edens01]KPN18120.1 hypothetical protein AO716_09500 [Arthrobacter sp. Edens01]